MRKLIMKIGIFRNLVNLLSTILKQYIFGAIFFQFNILHSLDNALYTEKTEYFHLFDIYLLKLRQLAISNNGTERSNLLEHL